MLPEFGTIRVGGILIRTTPPAGDRFGDPTPLAVT